MWKRVIQFIYIINTGSISQIGATACYQCPAGTFANDNQCIPCPYGYYNPYPSQSTCAPCPAGIILIY